MRVIFWGTPDIARDALKAIYEAGHEICAVITVPDKPNSRGKKIVFSEVKEFAIEHNLNLMQPEKLVNNEELKEEIRNLNPDIFCVVAYGKYLPKSYLKMCKYEPVNIHPSLLPKYRGSAPIQWAVLNGDKETGVTSMFISEKMDAGDIILQEKVEIGEYETTGELWDRLSKIGGGLLVKTLEQIENGTVKRIPQSENFSEVTMISKEMAKIDFDKNAEEIKNLIRGLNPFLGAYGILDGKKIKIWKAELKVLSQEYQDKTNGEVVVSDEKQGLVIKLKDGLLNVLEIQGENAKRMSVSDYLRGNKINIGNKFE
jgi:methionyl-tRNA formyltransferase